MAARDGFQPSADRAADPANLRHLASVLSYVSAAAPHDLAPPTAFALACALEAKDRTTMRHCERVADLAGRIAAELRLPEPRLERLLVAASLHDVGKIGLPNAILNKPGPLNGDEYALVTTHSRLGAELLAGAGLGHEARMVFHHHERFDGTGYPAGLAGEAIPLESRIILVADAFEAMTSDRPYRLGVPEPVALEELALHAGRQFDPACASALMDALGRPQPTLR